MFQGLNRVEIIGYVAKDPEVRETNSGKRVCNLTVPTSRKWGEQETTEWHKLVAWDRLAEICEKYVTKGTLLQIEGALQTRPWEDKDGNKRYQTEIVVQRMLLLPSGGKRQEPDGESTDNEVPF